MTKITTVVLDVDGTLTPQNSWTAVTEALGSSASQHMDIYYKYSEGLLDDTSAKQLILQLWGRTGRPTRQTLSAILRALPIRPEAHNLIQWLKYNQFNICLISGSMDVYVSLVAGQLDIASYFANATLLFDCRGTLADFNYFLDQSAKKVEQLQAYCDQNEIPPEEIAVVGNSLNDLGIFDYTDHGILLEEDFSPHLREHSWKVVHNLLDVKAILKPYHSSVKISR